LVRKGKKQFPLPASVNCVIIGFVQLPSCKGVLAASNIDIGSKTR
jgi:hypothetical protein